MIAASGVSDSSLIPSWVCPTICTCSVYVPGQTLIVSFGPEAFTAAWIDVWVACGQSPLKGVLSTQNVVPDDGGSGGSDVVSLAPTTASAMPATARSDALFGHWQCQGPTPANAPAELSRVGRDGAVCPRPLSVFSSCWAACLRRSCPCGHLGCARQW